MRAFAAAVALALAGCAASPTAADAPLDQCRAEVGRLSALLAAETAERQRITRSATRREQALRRQLDAMKAIERGILDREDRVRSDLR